MQLKNKRQYYAYGPNIVSTDLLSRRLYPSLRRRSGLSFFLVANFFYKKQMVSSGMTLLDDESNLGSGFAIKQLLRYRALSFIKAVNKNSPWSVTYAVTCWEILTQFSSAHSLS